METSLSHYQAGRLTAAITELGAELRKQPDSVKLRTFLFELLCFAGEFDRAGKQLDILAEQDAKAQLGAGLYKSLLQAHRLREEAIASEVQISDQQQGAMPVQINGKRYDDCEDEDLRIGASLEVYADGKYARIPYSEIDQIEAEKPTTLRDLLWIPVKMSLKEESKFSSSGPHVHLPALAPSTWRHKDDVVRLGRISVLEENAVGEYVPYGAKLLICGDEEISLLEVREMTFAVTKG
jgi:type VI secretion system protein ImpE